MLSWSRLNFKIEATTVVVVVVVVVMMGGESWYSW